MAALKLFPIAGMNNVVADDGLQQGGDSPKLYLRDAVNLDITDTGRLKLRQGAEQISPFSFKNIWQSPLHNDVFATLESEFVKLDSQTWQHEVLAKIGHIQICYQVINNLVYIASELGLWTYNGKVIHPLTIDTPAMPVLTMQGNGGSLKSGTYSVAISWLRDQQESALSQVVSDQIELTSSGNLDDQAFASIQINLPYCFDQSITHVRIYITDRNGGELLLHSDHPISKSNITISSLDLGMTARFKGLSPMPTGRYMKYWQGRLLTADKNILRFSEPMAYHLHDEKFRYYVATAQ